MNKAFPTTPLVTDPPLTPSSISASAQESRSAGISQNADSEFRLPPSLKAALDCTNPLHSTADALMHLTGNTDTTAHDVHRALDWHSDRIGQHDFVQMHRMLAAQAQLLHHIFTKAVIKYAGEDHPEKDLIYANIALKAQNYCRLTIDELKRMKERKMPSKSVQEHFLNQGRNSV